MFILAFFAKILERYYHYVDGIHYRSKYSTSSIRLKWKFDQIATLYKIFSNVSATCRFGENVSTACTFLFTPHVNRQTVFVSSCVHALWLVLSILICLLFIIQKT